MAMPDGARRCRTEIREGAADSEARRPPSLEGLILKLTKSELKIGRKIGEGAQAKIYAARHMNAEVVVKRFKYASQGHWPTELFKSYQCNVCQLIGYVEEAQGISLVMYKYDGDLRSAIDRAWPCKPQIALDLITQVALGMKRLHSQGVVHRDLKAENILVHTNEDGVPYVVFIGDFENSLWNEGTAFWRPPEVFRELKNPERQNVPLDKVSSLKPLPFSMAGDVYSFGMVCYEILTGKVPFEGHRWSDYDLIPAGNRPELPADLDVDLRDLILRCWRGDPDARPSFDEICSELRERAEAMQEPAMMGKFKIFDDLLAEKSEVCDVKRMVQSMAREYGAETEFVRLGFELVASLEQFVFHFGSLRSSFIDAPVLPFAKWLQRMWLCNAVQFKRYEFIAVLPSDIAETPKVVKLVWALTGSITDGCEKSTWSKDDSMTLEEQKAALLAFTDEQARQITLQKMRGLGYYYQVLARLLSRLNCLVRRTTAYARSFLGMAAAPFHRCEYCR